MGNVFTNPGTTGVEEPKANPESDVKFGKGEAFAWNSDITSIGSDIHGRNLLPEGDYEFTIVNCERDHYAGGAKLPPCPMAKLTLNVHSPNGDVTVKANMILAQKLQKKLVSFFQSIGQMKDETFTMNWSNVTGAKGYAHINVRSFIDYNGNERTVNDVERYITEEEFKANTSTQFDPGPNRLY